jgi:hypothetical protein
MIVLSLNAKLPRRYVAHPRVHLGSFALPAQEEYEVCVYDMDRDQRLVAAVELVSPANKDRPEQRRAFVTKCAAFLQKQVSVTIVDLVTLRANNLYGELFDLIGQSDPGLGVEPPAVYAVACRTKRAVKPGACSGRPAVADLAALASDDLAIPLDLEDSYKETCKVLRIA